MALRETFLQIDVSGEMLGSSHVELRKHGTTHVALVFVGGCAQGRQLQFGFNHASIQRRRTSCYVLLAVRKSGFVVLGVFRGQWLHAIAIHL